MKNYIKQWAYYSILFMMIAATAFLAIYALPHALKKEDENAINRTRCESLGGKFVNYQNICFKNGEKI